MAIPLLAVASLHMTMAPWFAGVKLLGGAGACPLDRAMDAQDHVWAREKLRLEIQGQSDILQFDKAAELILWKTPHGEFWSPVKVDIPFLLAEQITLFYGDEKTGVHEGDVVIDAGANVGAFVWKALNDGAALVVAVEPTKPNVESLRRNFAKEIEEGRVIVYPKGVWEKDDQLTFNTFENSALNSIMMDERWEEPDTTPTTVTIDVTTVDHIVADLGLEKVDFIKMDIEGAERNALQGARHTLTTMKPRMAIATENLPDDPVVLPALISEIQPAYRIECGLCSPRSLFEVAPDVFYFE